MRGRLCLLGDSGASIMIVHVDPVLGRSVTRFARDAGNGFDSRAGGLHCVVTLDACTIVFEGADPQLASDFLGFGSAAPITS